MTPLVLFISNYRALQIVLVLVLLGGVSAVITVPITQPPSIPGCEKAFQADDVVF